MFKWVERMTIVLHLLCFFVKNKCTGFLVSVISHSMVWATLFNESRFDSGCCWTAMPRKWWSIFFSWKQLKNVLFNFVHWQALIKTKLKFRSSKKFVIENISRPQSHRQAQNMAQSRTKPSFRLTSTACPSSCTSTTSLRSRPILKSVIHHFFASFDFDSAAISCRRPVQPPRPGSAELREKDKKRKHARNANNGQLTRLDEGKTFFPVFGPKRSTDAELFSAEIVRNSLAYLVTTKKGSPVLADRREDTLITEMKAQNSL